MVNAHRHVGTYCLKRTYHVDQARIKMRRLLEVAVWLRLADAGMHEVGAVGIFLCERRHVVVSSRAEAAGAESQAVVGIWYGVEESLDVGVAGYDAWQTEYLHRGIVGVNAHVDVIFIADGHDGVEEVSHVGAEPVGVDAFVEVEEIAEFLYGVQVVFGDVAVDESLRLDDDVFHETLLRLFVHAWRHFLAHTAECLFIVVFLGSLALEDVDVEIGELGTVEIEV